MANETTEKKNELVVKEKVVYNLVDMPGSIKSVVKSPAFATAIEGFFMVKANRERFVQSAVNAITKTPALGNCTKESFFASLMQLAQFGLNPDGRNAHLLPYNSKNGMICQLIIDYKGLVTLAMRCDKVSKVEAFAVHEKDHFRLVNGEVEHIVDNPWEDRGEVKGYYAVCQFQDGTKKYEVMSKGEVDAVRERSRAKNSGPWVTDYDEMAKKTVFRRLSKWLPVTPELQEAIARDEEEYQTSTHDFNRAARVTASELLSKEKKGEASDGDVIDVPTGDGETAEE